MRDRFSQALCCHRVGRIGMNCVGHGLRTLGARYVLYVKGDTALVEYGRKVVYHAER